MVLQLGTPNNELFITDDKIRIDKIVGKIDCCGETYLIDNYALIQLWIESTIIVIKHPEQAQIERPNLVVPNFRKN